MIYTVGEMAQKLGVPASTLRYYDKEGLLPFVERSSGGIRMFRRLLLHQISVQVRNHPHHPQMWQVRALSEWQQVRETLPHTILSIL